jgi:arginyl-tRNA synthetase
VTPFAQLREAVEAAAGGKPRDVAERLGDALRESLGPALDRVEVAGPGFLNLFLADAWYAGAVDWVLDAGDRFGA